LEGVSFWLWPWWIYISVWYHLLWWLVWSGGILWRGDHAHDISCNEKGCVHSPVFVASPHPTILELQLLVGPWKCSCRHRSEHMKCSVSFW
jgi:hypothetical protein